MTDEKKNLIKEIQIKKAHLEKILENLEKFIFDKETRYLESTMSSGNILKGWEHCFTSKTKIPARTLQPGKRVRINPSERLFSQTTFNNEFLKDDTPKLSPLHDKGSIWNSTNNSNMIAPKSYNSHRRKKKITQSLSIKKKKTFSPFNKDSDSVNINNISVNNNYVNESI